MTETELVKQVAAGAEAFAALVTLYRPALVRFCTRRVGEADAEEVTQDALLYAWQSVGKCKELGRFKSWVWGIARNKCDAKLRTRRDTVSLDEITEIGNGEDLAGDAAASETLARVLPKINTLPPKQRECIEMLMDEAGYGEIARKLGITEATARSHASKARATLHKNV